MVRVPDQPQDREHKEEEDRTSVTITEIEDVDHPADSVCVRTDSDVQIHDEDVSCTSSTQYSDVDDSLEGDELGSWSNDLDLPVSLQQNFDNGVSLPVSEAPTFGDVCVKNSSNVHFGNKTFYNGPVTIKQIVYSNPTVEGEKNSEDCNNKIDKQSKERNESQSSQEFRKATEWCDWTLTWRCVALICAMGSCLVAAIVVSVVFLSREPMPNAAPVAGDSSVDPDVLPGNKLYLIARVAWGAQPPNKSAPKLKHPVQHVIISETATVGCSTQSECVYRVRMAQTYDIESLKWDDIGCNFMIGGDGYAYVGRGWEGVAEGLHGYGPLSVGITFIGTFKNAEPPSIQLKAAQQLIKLGVDEGMIDPDYKLLALRQIAHNSNPGDALYNIIQKRPNYDFMNYTNNNNV